MSLNSFIFKRFFCVMSTLIVMYLLSTLPLYAEIDSRMEELKKDAENGDPTAQTLMGAAYLKALTEHKRIVKKLLNILTRRLIMTAIMHVDSTIWVWPIVREYV